MTATKKKPTLGWAFESPKGVISADVFSTRTNANYYADEYPGYNLVRVTISKFKNTTTNK